MRKSLGRRPKAPICAAQVRAHGLQNARTGSLAPFGLADQPDRADRLRGILDPGVPPLGEDRERLRHARARAGPAASACRNRPRAVCAGAGRSGKPPREQPESGRRDYPGRSCRNGKSHATVHQVRAPTEDEDDAFPSRPAGGWVIRDSSGIVSLLKAGKCLTFGGRRTRTKAPLTPEDCGRTAASTQPTLSASGSGRVAPAVARVLAAAAENSLVKRARRCRPGTARSP